MNRRILVVDDEPGLLDSYRSVLGASPAKSQLQSSRALRAIHSSDTSEGDQFDVFYAANYNEAIEAVKAALAEDRPFAMGFFDVRIGLGADGVELAREVLKLDRRMGIVFVTAYNDRTLGSIEATLEPTTRDQWDFLNKPFTEHEILQKARNQTSLWNLKKQKAESERILAELNQKVLEGERKSAAAAVARGVTHEFGNLLMQIIGKAEISRGKSESEMREAFEKILDAGQRAGEILDRFNNLSDNKESKNIKSEQSLVAVLEEALDLVAHQLKSEKIVLKKNIKAGTSFLLEVNSTSILQVFVNVMINSIYALKKSSQAEKYILIDVFDSGDSLVVTFSDNGPGAPAGSIEKLTEPFFTTKGSEGTGLGLAISKEIIEIEHQGEFKVANRPGGGFAVNCSFKRKRAA